MKNIPLLEIKDLMVSFKHYEQASSESIIKNISLIIQQGEIVALVGASGSGKSILAHAILGILPDHAVQKGKMLYQGKPLTKAINHNKQNVVLIPQSVNALDPLMKVGKQVKAVMTGKEKQERLTAIFRKVGLATEVGSRYPFELSGGMSRRVLVAIAIASGAPLMIADEPTPGLDPHILTETMTQLKQLANEGKGILFITHDIGSAVRISDYVIVLNEGEMVEVSSAADFVGSGERLKHSYTKALWNALPQNEFTAITYEGDS